MTLSKGTRKALTAVSAFAVLLAAGCGAGAVGTSTAKPRKPTAPATVPVSRATFPPRSTSRPQPSEAAQPGESGGLELLYSSKLDPSPLSPARIFPAVQDNGFASSDDDFHDLRLRTARANRDCATAVWGAPLRRTLAAAGCTQILRAAYVSGDGLFIGMIAVLNLRDEDSALRVTGQLDTAYGSGFLRLLPSPAALIRLASGYSAANATAYGHYVIVTWVTRTDGTMGSDSSGIDDMTMTMAQGPSEALTKRIPREPHAVFWISVFKGTRPRCTGPEEVPMYTAVDVVLRGNEQVSIGIGGTRWPGIDWPASVDLSATASPYVVTGYVTNARDRMVIHVSPPRAILCAFTVR